MNQAPVPTDHLLPTDLAAYLTTGPAFSGAARVKAHLADCAECRGEAIEVSRLVRGGGGSSARRGLRSLVALAAAAAVVLAVGTGLPRANRQTERSRDAVQSIDAAPVPIEPLGDAVVAAPLTFSWHPAAAAVEYRLTLLDAGGEVLWSPVTTDTVLVLPFEISLIRGSSYSWYLDVLQSDGASSSSGVKEFRVAP